MASVTFDDTHQNFAGPLGVASFGDIRLQETADNADGVVVNSSVLIGYQSQDEGHRSHAKISARTRPGPICRNAQPPRRWGSFFQRVSAGWDHHRELDARIGLHDLRHPVRANKSRP
jgi:hypothetical protein